MSGGPEDPADDPWAIIRADELSTSVAERGDRGAWYTPRAVVEEVTGRAFAALGEHSGWVPSFVVDPTCGGGAFLIGALDALTARGVEPGVALSRVAGLDSDRGAVATARRAQACWASSRGVAPRPEQVQAGDALRSWPEGWPTPDLILGNPPFASPLRSSAGAGGLPPAADRFRRRHRDELGPYADLAAIHLLNAAHRLDPVDGRLAMVMPQSILAGRDAASLRDWLGSQLPLCDLWITDRQVFDASVHVCAPILARPSSSRVRPSAQVTSWADAAASAAGLPDPGIGDDGERLGPRVTATAGFRDEYYGLRDACVEGEPDDSRCRLATVGSIDPLHSFWGERPTRFAKQGWQHPVVDEAKLPAGVRGWFDRQRQPKVLLPTQSGILEPFVDRAGQFVPVTPLLSIVADPDELDQVAALLLAPTVALWAARRSFGSALSSSAIKLRARDVADVPLPPDRAGWDSAAALVPEGPTAVDEIAERMHAAFGSDRAVLEWWRTRK